MNWYYIRVYGDNYGSGYGDNYGNGDGNNKHNIKIQFETEKRILYI